MKKESLGFCLCFIKKPMKNAKAEHLKINKIYRTAVGKIFKYFFQLKFQRK